MEDKRSTKALKCLSEKSSDFTGFIEEEFEKGKAFQNTAMNTIKWFSKGSGNYVLG